MSDAINWDVFVAALAALVAHDVIVLIGTRLDAWALDLMRLGQ